VKKFVQILLLAVVALALTSCADSRRQFNIVDGGVASLSVGSPIKAVLKLTFDNPSHKYEVMDITGKVKHSGSAILDLQAEDFTIPARDTTEVLVPVEARLEPGTGILTVMRMISARDLSNVTVSLTFTVKGFLGFRKTETIEDIPVENIIGLI